MMDTSFAARAAAIAVAACSLSACGGGSDTELRAWMDDTRKSMRPTTYCGGMVDRFKTIRLPVCNRLTTTSGSRSSAIRRVQAPVQAMCPSRRRGFLW